MNMKRYDNYINISAPKTPCVPYKKHIHIYRYIGINTDFSAVHFCYKSLFDFWSAYLIFLIHLPTLPTYKKTAYGGG